MTNEVRWRRKITGNPYCSHCLIEVETDIHVLRDCPKARMVREVLVKVEERGYFFSPNWYTWLLRNLMMGKRSSGREDWAMVFGIAIWQIWKDRNKRVFGNEQRMCNGTVGAI